MQRDSVQEARPWGPTVRSAAAGDEVAFARLIAAHDGAMRRVAFVIAGDWDTATEAVQEAWVKAWERLRTLRDQDRVEAWLVSIAANETRRLLSRGRRRTVVEVSAGSEGVGRGDDPGDLVDLVDLERALRTLRPDERTLIAMRFVAGLDSTEIGSVTGMSASGVRSRLTRLLERLRMELDHG
jgi:RNA polymerase sigma-70 factor (ECF subfamily)